MVLPPRNTDWPSDASCSKRWLKRCNDACRATQALSFSTDLAAKSPGLGELGKSGDVPTAATPPPYATSEPASGCLLCSFHVNDGPSFVLDVERPRLLGPLRQLAAAPRSQRPA